MHNRSDAFGFDNCPDKIRHAGDGHENRFDGEEVADLMHRKPDGGKATKPEEKEAEEVSGVRVGTRGERIGKVFILGPDGANHERYALPSDPGLNPIPNTCHRRSIEDWP